MFQKLSNFKFSESAAITSKLPLLGSPVPIFPLLALYLWFVLKAGPAFMQQRPAYNLKYLLLIYNFLQILINFGLLFYGLYRLCPLRSTLRDFGCIEPLPLSHPLKHLEVQFFYVYFLIKVIDLLETIFFVLRKSFKQISFLHVYHHLIMVLFNYFYLHYYGSGGHTISTGILNTLVHGFMYTYYLMSTLEGTVQYALKWKKHITQLQLLQFLLIFCHQMYPLLYRPHCKFPRFFFVFGALQSVHMMWLFGNFYWKNYIKGEAKKKLK